MHHYDPLVVADEGTGRPLVGVRAEVVDAETLAPVTTYRDGEPVPLISGPHGLIGEFQTDRTTRRVQITAGTVTLHRWCQEIADAAQDAADRASAAAAEAETAANAAGASVLADAKAYTDQKTTPTELGTQHLDTVDAPGDYMQSENAEVQVESGYPVPYAGSLTVAANATGHIVIQQYRTYRASDNGKAWTRTRYLGNWSAWAESGGSALPTGGTTGQVLTKTSTGEAWSDGPLVGYLLTGPGRPDTPATTEGVITGAEPVGAEYRSTDGAGVGAFVWMKRPGGAWAVTDGDTGWRVIFEGGASKESMWKPGANPPTGGRLRLRRVPGGLWVSADDLTWGAGTSGQFSMLGGLPTQWQVSADSRTYPGAFYVLGGSQPSHRVDRSDLIATPTGGRIRDIKFYPAGTAWPTALPGTPA